MLAIFSVHRKAGPQRASDRDKKHIYIYIYTEARGELGREDFETQTSIMVVLLDGGSISESVSDGVRHISHNIISRVDKMDQIARNHKSNAANIYIAESAYQ